MASERKLILIAGVSLVAQGCFVFDESIYKGLEGKILDEDGGQHGDPTDGSAGDGDIGDGDGDSTMDAAVEDDSGAVDIPLHLVNSCGDKDMYVLHDTHPSVEVSTVGFTDDVSSLSCLPNLTGPEGWMAIEMVAGDRWHFHVKPTNSVGMGQAVQNPVLYMRQFCDDSRMDCNAGTFLNLCGNGQDEHFTFEATSTTRWLFALDDLNGTAGSYLLTVAKPECNNMKLEHNEACDDGNDTNGDGCSSDCRVELTADNKTQVEFNDDWTTANLLTYLAIGRPQSVLGSIGGTCDQDMYGFNVPSDNVTVTATIGPANAAAGSNDCSQIAASVSPVTELRLIGSDGRSDQLKEVSNDPTKCPVLTMSGLAAGFYYIGISGDEAKAAFNYKLTVKLTK